jgi:hypothetical protein
MKHANETINATATRAVSATGVAANVAATVTASQAVAQDTSLAGWNLCKAETVSGHAIAALVNLHDDKIALAYFGYGYAIAFLLARGEEAAIAAAKADNADWSPVYVDGRLTNWPECGATLFARGRLIMDRGVEPAKDGKKRDLKPGQFVRSDMEQRAYKAVRAKFARVREDANPEQKAAKKRATRASKANKAKTAKPVTLATLPRPKTADELVKTELLLATTAEKLAKTYAKLATPGLASAVAAFVAAIRKEAAEKTEA